QRVRKVTENANGDVQDERIYLGGFELYREYHGNNAGLVRETLHIMDDKQRIVLVETRNEVDDGTAMQLIRYQIGNHLGSASLELNEQAEIISYEEYFPYGSTSYQAVDKEMKAAAKRYRYTGKERDEESGFYYHGARYYAPWLGRWVSCDPANTLDGPNLYCFVRTNPLYFADQTGRQSERLAEISRAEHLSESRESTTAPVPITSSVLPSSQDSTTNSNQENSLSKTTDSTTVASEMMQQWLLGSTPSSDELKIAIDIISDWSREERVPDMLERESSFDPKSSVHQLKVQFVVNFALVSVFARRGAKQDLGDTLIDARAVVTSMRDNRSTYGDFGHRSSESIILRDAEKYLWARAGPVYYNREFDRPALEGHRIGPLANSFWDGLKTILGEITPRTNPSKPHAAPGGKGWFDLGRKDFMAFDFEYINQQGVTPTLLDNMQPLP
ncbi:MAG: RHS repeat-associated core domain-containing protein, partial [Caldilineaceae bacterium]|nr:RHS repeat-associated core domain-containing protein [Caldilineaceae bacterium]